MVIELRYPVELHHAPAACGDGHDGTSRFGGVTLTLVLGQKGKAEVRTIKKVALDEAAGSNRRAVFFSLHEVHAKPEESILAPHSLLYVTHGIGDRTDSAISDVMKKRALIEKSMKERRIRQLHLSQLQTRSLRNEGRVSHFESLNGRLGHRQAAVFFDSPLASEIDR